MEVYFNFHIRLQVILPVDLPLQQLSAVLYTQYNYRSTACPENIAQFPNN
jgi:hypothetical protein